MNNAKYKDGFWHGPDIVLNGIRLLREDGVFRLYHSDVVVLENGIYDTPSCPNPDSTGFCTGHRMEPAEFIKRYCNGLDIPRLELPVLYEVPEVSVCQ